jgi:hypothetical protein
VVTAQLHVHMKDSGEVALPGGAGNVVNHTGCSVFVWRTHGRSWRADVADFGLKNLTDRRECSTAQVTSISGRAAPPGVFVKELKRVLR